MNYIKEMLAFFDRIELDGLSSSSVLLWYTLMQFNNKMLWEEEFSVPGSAILLKSGLTESSYKRARKELKKKGYLNYRSPGRNYAPVFRMISRESFLDQQMTAETDGQTTLETTAETALETSAFIKPKETKENQTVMVGLPTNAHTFYEQNLGMLNPFIAEKITQWCGEMPEELVVESMKVALQYNKPFFQYCEGVLKRWQAQGMRTIGDVLAPQERKQSGESAIEGVDQIFEEVRRERKS